jgi:short-subunit dehydrogenase
MQVVGEAPMRWADDLLHTAGLAKRAGPVREGFAMDSPNHDKPEKDKRGSTMNSRGVAVVTGASAGIGRATAVEFAARGFDVALVARGTAGLEAAAKDVATFGRQGLPITADVSMYDQVENAAATAECELGAIDVWVNDAMTTVFAPLWEVAPEDFRRAVEVTFLGQVWGTKAALARMMPRDRGSIVNVGSALALLGIPLQSSYCSAKFACRGFFESVRSELLHEKSHVSMSMVHLPGVNTTQFDWCKSIFNRHPQPVPPIYEPEVPARFIVDAAIDGRRDKIVGSWNKLVVTIAKLMPGVANQYAALGAWETQLTDEPVSTDRPFNLSKPLDDDCDHGSHGIFEKQAHGFFDPGFLKSLPKTAKNSGNAFVRNACQKLESQRARREERRRSA